VVSGFILVIWFVFSQMIAPGWKGTTLFPFFRRTSKKKEVVKGEIRELHDQGELTALQREAEKLTKKQQKGPGPKKGE
jgi:hypothetical protein